MSSIKIVIIKFNFHNNSLSNSFLYLLLDVDIISPQVFHLEVVEEEEPNLDE